MSIIFSNSFDWTLTLFIHILIGFISFFNYILTRNNQSYAFLKLVHFNNVHLQRRKAIKIQMR